MSNEILTAPIVADSGPGAGRPQAFQVCMDLLTQLHVAMSSHDKEEARRLREEMDEPYEHLSQEETDWLGDLSGDLYLLDDKEVFERTNLSPQALIAMLKDAQDRGDGERMLWVLRRMSFSNRAAIAHFRANAYGLLGYPRVALCFRHFAAEHFAEHFGPRDSDYPLLFLEDLKRFGLKEMLRKYAEDLLRSPSVVVRLYSAVTTFSTTRGVPPDEAGPLLRRATEALEGAVSFMPKSGELDRTLSKQEIGRAYMTLCCCYERLGEAAKAREAADAAVAVSPNDDGPFVVRGQMLMSDDLEAAVTNFKRAAKLKTQHYFPYLFLALRYLSLGNPSEALKMGQKAVAFADSNIIRAQALHAVAICLYELKRPLNKIRAKFDAAISLDPQNKLIRANRDLVLLADQRQEIHPPAPRASDWTADGIFSADFNRTLNDIAKKSEDTASSLALAA